MVANLGRVSFGFYILVALISFCFCLYLAAIGDPLAHEDVMYLGVLTILVVFGSLASALIDPWWLNGVGLGFGWFLAQLFGQVVGGWDARSGGITVNFGAIGVVLAVVVSFLGASLRLLNWVGRRIVGRIGQSNHRIWTPPSKVND